MGILKDLKRRLDNLDKRVYSSQKIRRINRIGLAVTLGVTAGLAAFRYCSWRNEYDYRQQSNVVAPRYYDLESANEANRLLVNFPSEMPGAAGVDKYITPDAKYCLVHIRQEHITEKITEQDKESIAAVQSDIYQILSYLIGRQGLKEVYHEGYVPGMEDIPKIVAKVERSSDSLSDLVHQLTVSEEDRVNQEIRQLEREILDINQGELTPLDAYYMFPNDNDAVNKYILYLKDKIEGKTAQLPEAMEKDKKYNQEREEQLQERNQRFWYSAVKKLVAEGKLSILAVEEIRSNDLAGLIVEKEGWEQDPNKVKVVVENREDIVLQKIASQNAGLWVCVYGGAHLWGGNQSFGDIYPIANGRISLKDNIAEWNSQHPDKKFSLIEITPQHYSAN